MKRNDVRDRTARTQRAVRALVDRVREDAPVTRREYLRILVTVSGGLLAGTVGVATGVFRRHGTGTAVPRKIADSLAPGQAVNFRYPTEDDPAIAIRLADGSLVGYSTVCTHLSCAVLWNGPRERLECPCHNGVFNAENGTVAAGPPPRPLPKVHLEERDGAIWATGTSL